jgi:predicted DNA-binding protein with PD1-like motif
MNAKEATMKAKQIGGEEQKTHVLVFDKGEEVMAGLLEFASERGITSGHLTAIGAFSDVTLGFFDRERKDYRRIPLSEQVEALSLVGDVALKGAEPQVHAHIVVGRADGAAYGGHLLEAHVWPTLEVVLIESPAHLRRDLDEETGLPLIALEESG